MLPRETPLQHAEASAGCSRSGLISLLWVDKAASGCLRVAHVRRRQLCRSITVRIRKLSIHVVVLWARSEDTRKVKANLLGNRVMTFDHEKFRSLVLYIIWKTSHRQGFGSTKLNKALWFAEARTFEAFGKPISGETFVRDKYGPRSTHLTEVCNELESNGLIEKFVERIYDYEAVRYRAFEPPATPAFTNEELGFVDWWIAFIDKHTAASISDFSHDYGWEIAAMGEELPIYAFLASKIRAPEGEQEIEWAQKEAKRLGLK